MTFHTPIQKVATESNMVQVEIQSKLREQISKAVKLSRLLQTLNTFVNPRNPRAGFPFHLEPGAVLNLYRQSSPLSYQMSGILKDTKAPQQKVSFLEALELIIQALTTFINNQYILESKEHGTEVLKSAVQTVAVNPELLSLVTGLLEPTLEGFLKKSKILFEELLFIGNIIRSSVDNWQGIRKSLVVLLKEPISEDPATATQTFQSTLTRLN